MKAIEYTRYGGPEVFRLSEVPQPQPKANEVLIKVHAATVTAADLMMRRGKPLIGRLYLGLTRPKRTILGFEFAGEVVALGTAVTAFRVGDRVFGGTTAMGAYAEYVCVSDKDVITTLPANIGYDEAAPVTGSAITVLNFLKGLANVQHGQKVLINGAAGGLGTYAVQYAKLLGAEVTAVCSGANVDMVKALGADIVVDYLQTDLTQTGAQYDVIFDAVSKSSFARCSHALTQHGVYLPTVIGFGTVLQMIWTSLLGRKKVKSSATGMLPVKERLQYLLEIGELMAAGKLKTVIDRRYALTQMPAAHEYVALGHKKGSVVVSCN
jgi:NADPH:quinone reductase-like Zn-dependent oxidoreductase